MLFINSIKGFLIGLALVIPGLSGSIFAVVVGLYEPLLAAVNNFRQAPKRYLKFLAPIGFGAIIGILVSTKIILWLTQQFAVPSYAFFLGLVLGILPFVWRKMQQIKLKWWYFGFTIAGFLLILLLTRLGSGHSESYVSIPALSSWSDAGTLLFAGAFSVALMIIPGISGSIMLMVIGQYGTVYHAVGASLDLIQNLIKGHTSAAQKSLQTVLLIIPFMIGALLGSIIIAKLMHFLLKHFESQVYYGVLGVVIAAVIILWQSGIQPYIPKTGIDGVIILIIVIMIILGGLATIFLDKPE